MRPALPNKHGAWEKMSRTPSEKPHLIRLRVKCCKLVDQPDMEELAIELNMMSHWLELMVKLDEGFDLNIEAIKDEECISVVEAVLSGKRPVAELPKAASPAE